MLTTVNGSQFFLANFQLMWYTVVATQLNNHFNPMCVFLPFGKNACSFFTYLRVSDNCVATIGVMHFSSAITSVVALFYFKGVFNMPDYKALYYNLFNAVTDTIEALKKAQQDAEELYLEQDDDDETEEEKDG